VIVGLVTCYREGSLVTGAINSLRHACEIVLVLEGPAPADREPSGEPSQLPDAKALGVLVRHGKWEDDAAKRTELVLWARQLWARKQKGERGGGLWLVWCDADEVLLWPEYLRDYIDAAVAHEHEQNATGGFPLRHVEPDGSVHFSWGRVLNGLNVVRYLVSGYQLELTNGLVVALPLTPLCAAGGIPIAPEQGQPREPEEVDRWLARNRPPLQGEPHILHRHPLRARDRARHRMHDDEGAWFERTVAR
jgi:hypothetical protein